MRKSPIKITLKKNYSALASGDYVVTQIQNAITVWENPTIRVGDVISEEIATKLVRSIYEVTVKV